MKIVYRREMKHNYLIAQPEGENQETYELHMMSGNTIEGLLKFHFRETDGQSSYCYEITSKQSLSHMLDYRGLGQGELKKLISGIYLILGRLEPYLLSENGILLEPQYIYIEPERFLVFLCLIPARTGDFPKEMTGLLHYLLGKIDHQDKECVVMAYALYQTSLKENYGIGDLMKIVENASACRVEEREQESFFDREEPAFPVSGYTKKGADKAEMERSENAGAEMFCTEKSGVERFQRSRFGAEERKKPGFVELAEAVLSSAALVAGIMVVLWLNFGLDRLGKRWWAGATAGVLGITFLQLGVKKGILSFRGKGREREDEEDRENKEKNREELYDWQIAFEEDREEREPEQEELTTTLLVDTEEKEAVRYLRAMGSGTGDIAVSYVPYLIGKQEGLADYILNRETVSRVHARIDKEGEEYRITDLNSTNGTRVNGHLLETNETVGLKAGDEIFIANAGFIFT